MCRAFSCIILKNGDAKWKFGIDSHSSLMEEFGIRDISSSGADLPFAKVEITPDNRDYMNPDKWSLHIDESIMPEWWTPEDEKIAFAVHKKWLQKLKRILVKKSLLNPLSVMPPKKVTKQHIALLKQWYSVWDSVRDSVWYSVWDSVRDSVWDSVGNSVGASVWAYVWANVGDSVRGSVGDSVWDSVGAYAGSFFNLPLKNWHYTGKIKSKNYPFQPAVDLWERGLIPSFDGSTWRLHGGPKAEVVFSIAKHDL